MAILWSKCSVGGLCSYFDDSLMVLKINPREIPQQPSRFDYIMLLISVK